MGFARLPGKRSITLDQWPLKCVCTATFRAQTARALPSFAPRKAKKLSFIGDLLLGQHLGEVLVPATGQAD